jgi:hypothetical protein
MLIPNNKDNICVIRNKYHEACSGCVLLNPVTTFSEI